MLGRQLVRRYSEKQNLLAKGTRGEWNTQTVPWLLRCMGTTPSFFAMFLKGDNFRDILFAYRCMGTFPAFPPFFSKGDSFHDFQFAYLNDADFPKWCLLFMECICSDWKQMTPIYMRGNHENDGVASPERVPIHLNFVKED